MNTPKRHKEPHSSRTKSTESVLYRYKKFEKRRSIAAHNVKLIMVGLRNMTPSEFVVFRLRAIKDYAAEQVASGEWDIKVASQKAQEALNKQLPNGLATEKNQLWSIVDPQDNHVIGTVWIQARRRGTRKIAHILDLFVNEPYRRQGFAYYTIQLIEQRTRMDGIFSEITLHVFGHNTPAIALYKKSGFDITDVDMVKKLEMPNDNA